MSGIRLSSYFSLGLFPLVREHRVGYEVFVMVVNPFGLTVRALFGETEAFGYAAAARVLDGAENFDAVQTQLPEGVIDEHADRLRHYPATLQVCGEPVADVGLSIRPVDVVVADAARKAFAKEDERGEALILCVLSKVAAYELARVFDRVTVGRPRHPLHQVQEVAPDERRQLLRVAFVHGPKFEAVFDSVAEHLRHLSPSKVSLFFVTKHAAAITPPIRKSARKQPAAQALRAPARPRAARLGRSSHARLSTRRRCIILAS